MKKRTIRFCYRKIIDAASQKAWDKLVFESTYTEFRMQAQFYNTERKYDSFAELLIHVPASEKLHFLVSAAVTGYLQQLNGIVPDILNNLGKHFLRFREYRFEIVSSDVKNKLAHQVSILFLSEPLIWHDNVGDLMLISPAVNEKEEVMMTDLVRIQPFLSIYSIKEEAL
jgi:hypothetical protein